MEEINSIQQTTDSGYIAAGWTNKFGAGRKDFFVLKLCYNGDIDPACKLVRESHLASTDTNVTPVDVILSDYSEELNSPVFIINDSVTSADTSTICLGNTPPAPKNLKVKVISSEKAKLKWKHRSKLEYGFKIERKKGNAGTWAQIATTPKNKRKYVDTGLIAATRYRYRVRAYNAVGNSDYSNVILIKTKDSLQGFLAEFLGWFIFPYIPK